MDQTSINLRPDRFYMETDADQHLTESQDDDSKMKRKRTKDLNSLGTTAAFTLPQRIHMKTQKLRQLISNKTTHRRTYNVTFSSDHRPASSTFSRNETVNVMNKLNNTTKQKPDKSTMNSRQINDSQSSNRTNGNLLAANQVVSVNGLTMVPTIRWTAQKYVSWSNNNNSFTPVYHLGDSDEMLPVADVTTHKIHSTTYQWKQVNVSTTSMHSNCEYEQVSNESSEFCLSAASLLLFAYACTGTMMSRSQSGMLTGIHNSWDSVCWWQHSLCIKR